MSKRKQKKTSHNSLKEVKPIDLFANTSIKRSEPLVKKNKKTETGIHSDDEFERSLMELDQIEESVIKKKANNVNKETNETETIEFINKKVKDNGTKTKKSPAKREHSLKLEKRNEKSKETKNGFEKDSHSNDKHVSDVKMNSVEQKEADFSEFIENSQIDEVPNGKKRKMNKSLNESGKKTIVIIIFLL